MDRVLRIYLTLTLIRGHLTLMCIHDEIQNTAKSSDNMDKYLTKDNVQYHGKRRRSLRYEEFKPLRIHTHYVNLEVELFDKDIQYLTEALANVTKKISSILSVLPVEGPLLLERKRGCHRRWGKGENAGKCSQMNSYYTGEICADKMRIPDSHLDGLSIWNKTGTEAIEEIHEPGPGLNNTDYVLYVQALSTRSCQIYQGKNVLAYAVYCHQNTDGRPVSGYVNVCPRQLQSHLYSNEHLKMVLIHEVFHALGFSSSLFPEFLKCKGNRSECESYGESIFRDVQGIMRMVTPSVVRHAQKHFNCTNESRFGGPMELNNGQITSHWHSLLMYGSVMAPTIDKAHLTILDPLTLGLFEDTGWYHVNFRYAEPYFWGKDTGCNFGIGQCDDYPQYFCNKDGSGCHYLQMDLAECKKISKDHKCKVFKPLHEKNECFMPDNTEESDSEFSEGDTGICLISRFYTKSSNNSLIVEGKCYSKKCINQTLLVKLSDKQWTTCPYKESLQVPNTFQDTLGKIEQFRLLSSMERIKEALQIKRINTAIECPRNRDITCPVIEESTTSSSTITPLFSTLSQVLSTDEKLVQPTSGPTSSANKDISFLLCRHCNSVMLIIMIHVSLN